MPKIRLASSSSLSRIGAIRIWRGNTEDKNTADLLSLEKETGGLSNTNLLKNDSKILYQKEGEMYIPEFICGILTALIVEAIAFIIWAITISIREWRKDKTRKWVQNEKNDIERTDD